MSAPFLSAVLRRDEAVLRFPYDERLRRVLRSIPERRWDPQERTWCVPLGPEQAAALALLLAGLHGPCEVEAELERRISRRSARRRRDVCTIEPARPDGDWWLSFATDGAPRAVEALVAHPRTLRVPEIGRALIPLDERTIELLESLQGGEGGLVLSPGARRLLEQHRNRGEAQSAAAASAGEAGERAEVAFRRDRRGEHWILVGAAGAATARVLAARAGLAPREGPAGSIGLAAREQDAAAIAAVLYQLEDLPVEARVRAWLKRVTTWRGNVEVQGGEAPGFLLLGPATRLPAHVAAAATPGAEGVVLPLTLSAWELIEHELEAWVSPAAERCAQALRLGRPAPPAVLERSAVHEEPTFVLAPGHDASLGERFAALDGALAPAAPRRAHSPRLQAVPRSDHGTLPAIRADPFCVPQLDAFLAGHGVWVQEEALGLLQEVREQHAAAAGLVALSAAREGAIRVPGLGGELKPFQRAGVEYLLARRRAFLADEQGLGKTIEALAALEADGAFPAVVVCPANLKLNWMREIAAWLPRRTARMLSGGAGDGAQAADVTVVNYEILGRRLDELAGAAPRAVVLDEAHYCKNPSAKRTQASQRLAAAVAPDGLVLALSGTPVVNRPTELVAQLRILGRLEEFGSGARFGRRFTGPDAHRRLHWHMRARCFVRRCKHEVLPQLPAKTRSVVPIELDNEAEYRLAERDLVAWLHTQPLDLGELDARVAAALRAERLVRLGALKLLAARGKLAAALAWIHDFCSSGERLVVFARHREIQRAVTERFPAALHILGEDSPARRDAALGAFQQPDGPHNQILVCSLDVAGQGLTLTRSSNVAFLELDWTPARHDQAEDRCHRIGQQDAVNAYYLLAADTVDERIAELLERKRGVIGAVTDGREQDDEAVIDALVRELRGGPYRHLRAVA